MEHALSSYDYLFVGGPQHIYTFKSRFEASYEIKFKPSPELVDNPDYKEFMFEMVITLTDNPYAPKLPPVDALMSTTIARILTHFFETHERVVVYLCDDSDSKADSRRKLFDRWYDRFRGPKFVKMNIALAVDDANGVQYSVDFISRIDNPYFTPIYESFKRTVSGEK